MVHKDPLQTSPASVPSRFSSRRGVALIVVLSLVAVMAMLAVVFFSSTTAESQSSQTQSSAQSAQQLASSAAQIVMTQIKTAGNQTAPGNSAAVAWTSQPGLLRTFTPTGASTVYKLYSATDMVTGNFSETDDAPPATWKSSPAIYCDLNAPVARADAGTSLAYPIADPSVAAVSLTSNLTASGTTAVPGFAISGTVPGYTSSNPSPTNNPLPMPVRWLYVLKNGQLTTPSSVDAGGNVTFTATDPQPSTANPVVGRIAFWADDETSKVNINTAGYAKNDESYWTYWDAPNLPTVDELLKLNAQPWTNEFLRYPGHPATTGLNLVFEGVSLTANQTASLTPRYNDGGTLGGTNPADSGNNTALAIKTARLFPTVDEMFYNPTRGAAATGISSDILEARRFFLTATSRAPETTLLDTPKVTLWPVWQNAATRTATDKLIAFCSTIGSGTSEQPFYFVRSNASRTDELTAIAQNSELYSYLQTLTSRSLPGVGTTSFETKYDSEPVSRDQILTSFYDAIRLTNLWDKRAGSVAYTQNNVGWVNYTAGPNNTFSLGRNPTLQEVNVIFLDQGPDATNKDYRAFLHFQINVPTAGTVPPGQNFRMRVTGLGNLTANGEPIFKHNGEVVNGWENRAVTRNFSVAAISSGLGGRIPAWINATSRGDENNSATLTMKVTTNSGTEYVLNTINQAFSGNITAALTGNASFAFGGGNLRVELYAPATSATPYQTFDVNLPSASNVVVPARSLNTLSDRFTRNMAHNYEQSNLVHDGQDQSDTILGVATIDGDMRSRALRQSFSGADFRENAAYQTTTSSRRVASTIAAGRSSNLNPITDGRLGRLIKTFTKYSTNGAVPFLPSGVIVSEFDAAGNWVGQAVAGAGDWDNGIGGQRDGSFSPKPDEGLMTKDLTGGGGSGSWNYFSAFTVISSTISDLFTPNRQVPSAAIYGNLPTGRWRTLLFRPARAWHMGGTNHFGAASPADMYLLDLFHMPIVEPYAISEPFSTAGKINMNARMVPFSSYVTRETALHALLASTRLTAYNSVVNASGSVPTGGLGNSAFGTEPDVATRFPLKIDETLKGFRERYDGTDGAGRRVFVSPAEICSLDLVPDTSGSNAALFGYGTITKANLASFWAKNVTTGDNSRERPYAHLLPRLTTKSNSYTVHVTAQALAPGPGATGWQEGKGKILSEWRGAYTIERYVDPNDSRFTGPGAPDFLSGTQPVGPYYKFRILGARRFNP
jgi:uncharacterized protein (TIGR02600 family)